MSAGTLYDKVWDLHRVAQLPGGSTQLFIGLHLIHEVTSPQAFGMIRDLGLKVAFPKRTFATVDHIVPTDKRVEPFQDSLADAMIKELRKNCSDFGITFFDIASGKQGIVHIVGPEQGITQPGTTIACGDSHTSTHGAFGAVAFGIGTSQVRDVLATQTMALSPLKVPRHDRQEGASGIFVTRLSLAFSLLYAHVDGRRGWGLGEENSPVADLPVRSKAPDSSLSDWF